MYFLGLGLTSIPGAALGELTAEVKGATLLSSPENSGVGLVLFYLSDPGYSVLTPFGQHKRKLQGNVELTGHNSETSGVSLLGQRLTPLWF